MSTLLLRFLRISDYALVRILDEFRDRYRLITARSPRTAYQVYELIDVFSGREKFLSEHIYDNQISAGYVCTILTAQAYQSGNQYPPLYLYREVRIRSKPQLTVRRTGAQ